MEMDKGGEPQQKPSELGERIEITSSSGIDGSVLGVASLALVEWFVFEWVFSPTNLPNELLMIRNIVFIVFFIAAFQYVADLNADAREAKKHGIPLDDFRSAKKVATRLYWEKYFEKRKAWANEREARRNSLAQKMDLK